MNLEFAFFDYTSRELVIHGLIVVTNIFLVFGAYALKRDEREFKYTNFLFIMSILLLIYSVLRIFLPKVSPSVTVVITNQDMTIGFLYSFVRTSAVPSILQGLLGISFILFGGASKKYYGNLILISGVFAILAAIISLSNNGILSNFTWFNADEAQTYINSTFITLSWIYYGLAAIALIFILAYSIQAYQKLLIIYGILLVVQSVIYVENFISAYGFI
jgi:hypothetical protein